MSILILFFPIGSKISAATPGLSTTPTIETLALFFEYAMPVTTFFSSIKMLTDTLRNIAAGSQEALDKIVKFLDSKIKELEEINKALQAILAIFTTGLPDTGVYTLTIPPAAGGNDYIKAELQGAEGRPPDSLDFTFGFMMVGGSASTKTLQTLLTAGSA